ncbi:hypothetical protein FJY71_03545, partial [candidate division WOR-3 bacterium]|nr:hypothetical protein [candidate division WOR-3 bacterium]
MNESNNRGSPPEGPSGPESAGRPRSYWEVVSRRHWLLVGVFAAVTALVFLAGTRERPLYRSSATLLLSQDGLAADPSHLFGQPAGILNRRPNLANHIELLKSYALAERVRATLPDSLGAALERWAGPDVAAGLQRGVAVRPVRDADMVRLNVVAPRPELARALAAAYVDAYRSLSLERSRADINAVKDFVRSQLEVVGWRLDSAETALERYKRASRITDLSAETRALVDRQTSLLALHEQARAERTGCEHELAWLTGLLDSSGLAMGVSLDNTARPVLAGLRAELCRLEAERTNLLIQGYADTSLRVRTLAGRIAALKPRLGAEAAAFLTPAGAADGTGRAEEVAARVATLRSELARLRAAEAALDRGRAACDDDLRLLPVRERTLARMTRNVEVDRQVHALLAQRYEETRIQEAGRL